MGDLSTTRAIKYHGYNLTPVIHRPLDRLLILIFKYAQNGHVCVFMNTWKFDFDQ